ncbi:MAG: protoheme IX farnesyltransferase [Actinobacteria bacterium]|nr:protoheme IX farnesyltransferase [Actinomycetota bacterium]
MSAGPWLRLTALSAAFATGVVVVTGEWARSHQASVLVALALLVGVAASATLAHRGERGLNAAAWGALALFHVQIGIGGLVALTDAGWVGPLHVVLGGASLAVAAVTAALAFRGRSTAPRGSWRDYVTLTKPRIMSLLLLTGAGGLVLGAEGLPSPGLALAALGGLALACGGASALNHVLDRDIDRLMGSRTEKRPVAAGRVPPARALEFALALSALSFVVLTSFVNVLAAVLALLGNLFYVLVYTRWLKRSTPQNIVIGGAAGAVPPVVGWAAATGNLALPALLLFLIVFFWTPPHFWALALLIRRNYEAAGVPMLPVVRGDAETARSILRYSVVLVAITLLPVLAGTVGLAYLAAAILLGGVFLALALLLAHQTTPQHARHLFSYSLLYLALLFVALAVDPLVL